MNSMAINGLVVQPDGKLVAVGSGNYYPYPFQPFNIQIVARYNSNGTLDSSFGVNGLDTSELMVGIANGVALQRDGRIVTVGTTPQQNPQYGNTLNVVRYNIDGSLDGSFGTNGAVVFPEPTQYGVSPRYYGSEGYSLCLQNDGKIIVAGASILTSGRPPSQILLLRLN